MVKSIIKIILNNKLIKEIIAIFTIGILATVFSYLDLILCSATGRSFDFSLIIVFQLSALNFIYFYSFCSLIKILVNAAKGKKLLFSGLVCIAGGALSFFAVSFIYAGANMDFVGFIHSISIYLSPLLVFIGFIFVILSFISKFLKKS